MERAELEGVLAFLATAERLKDTPRTGHTSQGRVESTAEHSWRLCLLALVMGDAMPGVDRDRLIRICLVHDLAEALTGDEPAPLKKPGDGKPARERAALRAIVAPLPPATAASIVALWEEYEAAATPEARLAKGLDKLETLAQHARGLNPPGFNLAYNRQYGRAETDFHPLLAGLRALLDDATEARLAEMVG